MYLSIVLLPLIGSIFSGFFGFLLGTRGSQYITTLGIILSFLFSCIAFQTIGLQGHIIHIPIFTWFDCGYFFCQWALYLDSVTVVMLVVVTSISSCVHIYSMEYMNGDPHHPRFMSYLSLFTFFMLILVTADNFIQLFVGWEGVGLCSYLLINFWFTRIEANKAAMKAIIVNRIGDFGLTLAILAIFIQFHSIDFATIFAIVESLESINQLDYLNFISICLFIGAVGKSAQIGLHTWLPDAMEGPTPVSALIHAATMVTAGVFLLIRCSPLLIFAQSILIFITIIGALTAFFAATSGLAQFDLKKVVAYSTCSQLGYMVFACGLSAFSVSLFHLFNHAFFKALLFLSCGSVIHALHDEQDMRKMGGLINILPFTAILFLIGSLALMGFPFLTGFYSKDIIIEAAYGHFTFAGAFAHWLASLSAFFTAFYSIRLFYLTFLTKSNAPKASIEQAHDAPFLMALPLLLLAIPSIFIGYFAKDLFIGLGTDFFQNAIPTPRLYVECEFLPIFIKLIPLFATLFGAFIGFFIYHFSITLSPIFKPIFIFFNQKWHWDNIYNYFIAKPILYIAYHHTFKTVDRGFLEIFGPTGIVRLFTQLHQSLSKIHTGFLFHYIFIFTFAIFFLLFLLLFFNHFSIATSYFTYLFYIFFFAIISLL